MNPGKDDPVLNSSEPDRCELWLGLDARLISQLPAELASSWPRQMFPRQVQEAPGSGAPLAGQKEFVAGLAALFATAPLRLYARCIGQLQFCVAGGIHADSSALLVRFADRSIVYARMLPTTTVADTVSVLLPVRSAHTLTGAVQAGGDQPEQPAKPAQLAQPRLFSVTTTEREADNPAVRKQLKRQVLQALLEAWNARGEKQIDPGKV